MPKYSSSPSDVVLVTGAAGFIGSRIVELLSKKGQQVLGVDGFLETTYSSTLKRRRFEEISKLPHVDFMIGDLRNANFVESLPKVEYIINCAAMPGLMLSWNQFSDYLSCNVEVVKNLLEYSKKSKVKNFVHSSTSSVYGKFAQGSEDSELLPFSPYGVSKLAAEHLISAYSANFNIPFTILRYFSVYGPRQRPDMFYSILCNNLLKNEKTFIYGDGKSTRTNTYVDDVARVSIEAIDLPQLRNQIVNISGVEEISVIQAVKVLSEILDVKPKIEFCPIRPGDQAKTAGDITKAKSLGLEVNRMTLLEGLKLQALHAKEVFQTFGSIHE